MYSCQLWGSSIHLVGCIRIRCFMITREINHVIQVAFIVIILIPTFSLISIAGALQNSSLTLAQRLSLLVRRSSMNLKYANRPTCSVGRMLSFTLLGSISFDMCLYMLPIVYMPMGVTLSTGQMKMLHLVSNLLSSIVHS